jgi:RimJ/RimL family protein N-acetyltransferase
MITTGNFFERDIILENELVRIEPLEEKHFELLLPVAMEESLWLFTVAKINSTEAFRKYFDAAMEEKQNKRSYPFAYFNKPTQQYAGSTRFGNIEFAHKKMEIGWTWIHPSLQGTGFNKHCKFLLLGFGFETLGLNRIELKTSSLNLKSQKAMLKIGAVKEGILRKNTINDDGSTRDTVYFSFLADEWPAVKQNIFKEFIKP